MGTLDDVPPLIENLPDAFTGAFDQLSARPAELAAAAIALAVVLVPLSWRMTRTVVTIAHEGGHALVAVLVGRGLTGIRLHADTSGVTHSTGAGRGPGVVLMFLAGYVAPPLLGLGGAALVWFQSLNGLAATWVETALLFVAAYWFGCAGASLRSPLTEAEPGQDGASGRRPR